MTSRAARGAGAMSVGGSAPWIGRPAGNQDEESRWRADRPDEPDGGPGVTRTTGGLPPRCCVDAVVQRRDGSSGVVPAHRATRRTGNARSEEHTSELQSRQYLVCRLLL